MKQNTTYTLNDNWYLIDGNGADPSSYHQSGIPHDKAQCVRLPCFTHMYIEDHVGISWYERTFTLPTLPDERQLALLSFEQAVFRAEVSVNGQIVGTHVGVEDPFSFDVTDVLHRGENRITVRISKPHEIPVDGYTFGEIPHRNQTPKGLKPGWCYNESGLSGEVSLRILPRVYIDDVYLCADPESNSIRAAVTVQNMCEVEITASLALETRLAPEGDPEDLLEEAVRLHPGVNAIERTLNVSAPRLWSVKEPNLYSVRAAVTSECGIHSAMKKTGFRTFIVGEDGYFYLNDERIYLRCSHTGNCMPESLHSIARDRELLRKDFLLAKAAGFNMLRFISGSALPLQMDLCDEIGLMVYEEPVSSWRSENGPHAAELYRQDLLSMVKRDRSHPSVTIWGLLNETYSTPPYDDVCFAARDILPELRKLDDTRLVLFSSGRWDKLWEVGSVANPGSAKWQKLWGWEGDTLSPEGDLGDIHYYPGPVPQRQRSCQRMRGFGHGTPRPVLVSETGIGSALDTVSLVRRFEQVNAIPLAPDVKMIRRMNDQFLQEIEKYGFADCIPFPSELMRGSMKNHAYYRTQMFDQLRANTNLCGISLTGLLDHSICGEGLWTLYREFKPMIADVLQDGFAKLRWCVFLSAPALWNGQKLTVEAALATEDVLIAGREYEVRAGILGKDGAYDIRTYRFTVTGEQAKHMVVPVFTDTWDTADLPAGEYEFKAELVSGAEASGGIRTFHICPKPCSRTARTVYAAALSEGECKLLSSLAFTVRTIDEYESDGVILAGAVTSDNRDTLAKLLENGAKIVAARAAGQEDRTLTLLPQERRPTVSQERDWLYHRETVLRPRGKYFDGMQTGLADALLYTGVLTPNGLEAEGAQVPDETDAFVFETGCPNERGFIGGFKLGTYRVGQGTLVINSLDILDSAGTVPYSVQLLANILDNV